MKSAYELAMERLERERGPVKKLTDAQSDQLVAMAQAVIDSLS